VLGRRGPLVRRGVGVVLILRPALWSAGSIQKRKAGTGDACRRHNLTARAPRSSAARRSSSTLLSGEPLP
jgi:hypothetical protein